MKWEERMTLPFVLVRPTLGHSSCALLCLLVPQGDAYADLLNVCVIHPSVPSVTGPYKAIGAHTYSYGIKMYSL